MRIFLVFITLVLSTAVAHADFETTKPNQLRITSLNIRWYGLGGYLEGNPDKEKRDDTIREFLTKYVPASDVMIFEEIVDVERLEKKILGSKMKCISYDHQDPKHQFVVICLDKKYSFKREPTDNNDVIDDVSINDRSRPAVTAIITDAQGRELLRVVGVHLKAMPNETKSRLTQVERIASYLKAAQKTSIPVLITGDFNTYETKDNGQASPDNTLFDKIFARQGLNIAEAQSNFDYTYRSRQYRSKFDRFWVSQNLPVAETVQVNGTCNHSSSQGPFQDPNYYYQHVSDHCPVTIAVKVK